MSVLVCYALGMASFATACPVPCCPCPAAVQVLECESVSHLTASSNLCFTSGKHCWQFVVTVPCDLVWLGLSDGTLTPDVWGGKQPGGWFYGSNDVSAALFPYRQTHQFFGTVPALWYCCMNLGASLAHWMPSVYAAHSNS